MRNRGTKYWIIVASKDHVKNGVADGIAQACHGKSGPLIKMNKGDFVIYYSGKQNYKKPEKCQEFTAIGEVKDQEVYSFQMTEYFCPFRRKITFFESRDIPISSLIDNLAFIQNKKYWGYRFRYGFLEINKQDFDLIANQMLIKSYA
ncbi:EVE domain-containing protein [Cyclobacterium sp. 1_MG-2023]|uniref:EVE domain-containing protein n=1 Tax=Cyclobacterium sp. 1_MG-2023 TaxID=3062681 RepID=UPI0026E2B1E9|nr:EVE domain-containing protein [Cyclobacterium sp. 1_MG-2023]MDO6437889.1 EVE domain-containing protein [Cyclobacterium sp. 1_MG-2023]